MIKALQEEQQLLREMEAALSSLRTCGAPGGGGHGNSSAAHSRAASASVVSARQLTTFPVCAARFSRGATCEVCPSAGPASAF